MSLYDNEGLTPCATFATKFKSDLPPQHPIRWQDLLKHPARGLEASADTKLDYGWTPIPAAGTQRG